MLDVAISRWREIELKTHKLTRRDAGISLLQAPEALREQTGTDQQQHREGDFSNNQNVAPLPSLHSATRTSVLQRLIQFELRDWRCRDQTKSDADHCDRQRHERKHARVDVYFLRARHNCWS